MISSSSFAKGWFILSLFVLAFGYGFVSHAWGLFPKTYVEQAWRQARHVYDPPSHANVGDTIFERSGTRITRFGEMQPGLTLLTSMWRDEGEWIPGLRLIDSEGEVLHQWQVDSEALFGGSGFKADPSRTDIHGSLLLENGDVILNLTYVGTARLDACGDVLWTLKEGGHHSISQGEDGTFWVTAVSPERKSNSENYPDGFPGLSDPVWMDRILHVSRKGKILEDISVLDILYRNDLERYIPKLGLGNPDVTHLNDIEPLPGRMAEEYPLFEAGDLVLSLHHINLVLVVDPESKEVKWHTTGPFILQHDPDFLGDGWIGIFDNNNDGRKGDMLGGSRVVATQPHTDSTEVLFSPQKLERFYTPIRGKWQMLQNGNMLLTESESARVVEVTPDGNLVWEWIQKPHNSKVPSVTKATRHDLTREDVAAWSCSSVDSIRTSNQRQ